MKRLWVTGYRSYELSVFKDNDPKVKIIKSLLHDNLSEAFNNGFNWIITGAQLGIEQWTVDVAKKMKKDYDNNQDKIAVMLPFQNMSKNWNQENTNKMISTTQKADFSMAIDNDEYRSPRQLWNYQNFMLKHTDAALLVYDKDYPGKTKFDYYQIKRYSEYHPYSLQMIDFDDLQEAANEYEENHKNSLN